MYFSSIKICNDSSTPNKTPKLHINEHSGLFSFTSQVNYELLIFRPLKIFANEIGQIEKKNLCTSEEQPRQVYSGSCYCPRYCHISHNKIQRIRTQDSVLNKDIVKSLHNILLTEKTMNIHKYQNINYIFRDEPWPMIYKKKHNMS